MRIDLKNIDFAIPLEDEVVFKFLIENNFSFLLGTEYVVSNISDSTYGVVYYVDDSLVFCKHKAIEVNKNQKPPRICTKIQKTCKIISKEDFDKNFRVSTIPEISILEMMEEKLLFTKKL